MADRPLTLLFIPGSWHKPSCYDKIINPLQHDYGIKCSSITLPSNQDNPAATFKDDVDVARRAITHEQDLARSVIVIAHSYGGMVGNSAIKDLAKPGPVIGLVLIASGFTLTGLSFMDPLFGHPPPSWRVNPSTGYAELATPPKDLFYHDVPDDEADHWVSQLTTQSLKALFEGGEHAYAGWQDVPVLYIGTVEDRGLPVALQRVQVGMARGMGATVYHRELQTSHSPFLSQPEEVVRLLLRAVEAFGKGREFEGHRAEVAAGKAVVPGLKLWSPASWVRFGLPLGFGRVIGWSMSAFVWLRRSFRR